MAHPKLENMASTALMLPKEDGDEKVVIRIAPSNGVGKILIREDTILANLNGCACGRAQFTCGGMHKNWSTLCWGQQSDKKYYFLLLLLSFTFGLSLIGAVFFCFTNTVNDAILSNMIIRNNSLAYSIWRKPNVQPLMKVHLFNYTNWQRVRDGLDKKLRVEDVGPYIYSQQIERVNIKFEGDQLTFQEKNTFTYLPDKTVGAHFDQVFVPNLPLLGAVSKAITDLPSYLQMPLNFALSNANHHDAFLKLPVHRFLWGYDDSIIDIAKPFLSLQGKLNFDNFGLLVTFNTVCSWFIAMPSLLDGEMAIDENFAIGGGVRPTLLESPLLPYIRDLDHYFDHIDSLKVKNGTTADRITINTGDRDMDRMNIIEKLNGEERLRFWGSQECNSIEGTDGSIFPPSSLDRKTPLHVFFPQLCRRIPFLYEKDVELSDGVRLLRYRMPDNVFDDPDHNPANQCYCEIDTAACPPRGVINVTACAMGAPALASFPHFFLGDPKLRQDIEGLHPDPDNMNFLDIHPTLGIALSGKSSLQLNIQVRKSNIFSALSFLEPGLVLPIAWIEMSVEELPESLRSLVYHGTYSTAAAQLGLVVVSLIALILSGGCLCCLLVRKRQKPCATIKKFTDMDTSVKPTSPMLSELLENDRKNQS